MNCLHNPAREARVNSPVIYRPWHAKANGDMWHFIGTYEASVVHSRDAGWQIDTMHLIKTSEDYRQILPRPEGT